MWCFSKLKQFYGGCSLREGMCFICWIGLVWNFGCFFCVDIYKTKPQPEILKFLDKLNSISVSNGHNFTDYSELFYGIQTTVMIFALLGIKENSRICLIPLVGSETLIFLMYIFMTLYHAYIPLYQTGVICLLMTVIIHCKYMIILNFYSEVSNDQNERKRGTGDVIIADGTASSFVSDSAPYPKAQIVPSFLYVGFPYAVEPLHASIITQTPTLTHPQTVIQTGIASRGSGSYYFPQYEKPPPYTP